MCLAELAESFSAMQEKEPKLTHSPINKGIGQVSSAIEKKNTGGEILVWCSYSCSGNVPKRSSFYHSRIHTFWPGFLEFGNRGTGAGGHLATSGCLLL